MKIKWRNVIAPLAAYLLIGFGFTKRAKRKLNKGEFILSVYFHSPGKALFQFCLQWMIKNNFNFLSQEEVYAIHIKNKPFPKSSVVITVDDGWQTNESNIVTIANKYKVPVTIFVSTDAIENGNFWWSYAAYAVKKKFTSYTVESLKKIPDKEREMIISQIRKSIQIEREALTIDQIKQIASSGYITIGSHTVSHPVLVNCAEEKVNYELKTSKQKIEEWIKKPVLYFAYPNGDYGDREIKYLKESGYRLAYTTKPQYLTKEAIENAYEVPRFNIHESISKAEAICRMLGVWQTWVRKI